MKEKVNNNIILQYLAGEGKTDPNIKEEDGSTPLHIASEGGDLDVVKYLKKYQKNPNRATKCYI